MIALYASWDEHIFDKFENKFAEPLGRSAFSWLKSRVTVKVVKISAFGSRHMVNVFNAPSIFFRQTIVGQNLTIS